MRNPILYALLIAACLCISCSKPAEQPAPVQEIPVGLYGSMTGNTATLGQSSRDGAQLAVEEINKNGGILGKKIRLIVEDDQSKPEEALTVVTKLITRDRVVAVIGENASSRSLAAAPACQRSKVPMISPSSTNPKVTQVGDYIFRVCFIDPFQGAVMAGFSYNSLKLRNMGILRDIRNEYSVGLAEVFREAFEKLGGKIVGDESYSEGDNDFNAQLTALKGKNPDGLFVPGYYTDVGLIARQSRKLGITGPLLGGDGWESPRLWEIGGEALNGSYYSNHYSLEDPSPRVRAFVALYEKRYGVVPDGVAALAFDSVNVLVDSFRRAGTTDGPKVRDAIAATREYPGITGSLTMDKDRNVIKPAVVLRIQDGKLHFVESILP